MKAFIKLRKFWSNYLTPSWMTLNGTATLKASGLLKCKHLLNYASLEQLSEILRNEFVKVGCRLLTESTAVSNESDLLNNTLTASGDGDELGGSFKVVASWVIFTERPLSHATPLSQCYHTCCKLSQLLLPSSGNA